MNQACVEEKQNSEAGYEPKSFTAICVVLIHYTMRTEIKYIARKPVVLIVQAATQVLTFSEGMYYRGYGKRIILIQNFGQYTFATNQAP